MIAGIGIDLVAHKRMFAAHARWGERLERRLLTDEEFSRLPVEMLRRVRRLASSFAAKEAFAKALGTGFALDPPLSILGGLGVLHNSAGAPYFALSEPLAQTLARKNVSRTHLSLSDEAGMTVACAIFES